MSHPTTRPTTFHASRTTPDLMGSTDSLRAGPPWRVGQGYDVHALVPGRPLILAGVRVPCELGLLGHSDADVLTHAIIDALFGAAGLGDIGRHFPDTDPAFKGVDSLALLAEAVSLVWETGFQPGNVDATVIAQRPRLAPYMGEMAASLARVLGVPASAVNVKAKTNERLGFEGRSEGIVAQAVVMIVRLENAES